MRSGSAVFLVLFCIVCAAQTPDSSIALAARQVQTHDYAGAVATLRPSLTHFSNNPDLWNLLGISESELNHPREAREAFEKGLKVAPDSVSLNENIGFFFYRLGDYAGAKKYLTRAISLGSNNSGVAFSNAAAEARTGHEAEALAALRKLEPQLSQQPEYWKERGRIELRQSPADATASFDRALALAPDDAEALNYAASAAEVSKDDEKALSLLVRARKSHPDDVATLLHFGALCLRRDLTVDARDALERAYKLEPANNLALFLYARVQVAFQQWQRAYDLFSDFASRVPGYAPAEYALGWLDERLNRPGEARQHLAKSLALDSSQLDVECELAQLDFSTGDLDRAEKELQAVLEKAPGHAKANLTFGDVMMRRGDLQQAKKHYESAIAADPSSGPAHYKLSTVLTRLNEKEQAERERAIGAQLNEQAEKASKVVLVLANPDGKTLRDAGAWKGVE